MGENKVDLAIFIIWVEQVKVLNEKVLVLSGGFRNPNVASTGCDLSNLYANHEEADTRILLHAKESEELVYDNNNPL